MFVKNIIFVMIVMFVMFLKRFQAVYKVRGSFIAYDKTLIYVSNFGKSMKTE